VAIPLGSTAAPSPLAVVGPSTFTYNDSTHVYMMDGTRCRSITNIAKIPTDDFTVNQWRHARAAEGFMLQPSLLEDIAAHIGDSQFIEATVQKAIEIGGGNEKARRGTQAHAATEYADLGQKLHTAQQHRDATVYQRTLEAYGIEVVARFIEQIVLYPDDAIAGRIDRYAWMDGHLFDFDIKTGSSAWRYPHATAVQLALHVAAPLIASVIERRDDGLEHVTQWQPQPPELRRDIAYIISMPTADDADLGALYRFQLTGKFAGHVGREIAITARHFQLNNDLCERIPAPLRPAPAVMSVPESYVAITDHTVASYVHLHKRIGMLADADKARLRERWVEAGLPHISSPMTDEHLTIAMTLVNECDPFARTIEPPAPAEAEPLPPVHRPEHAPYEGDQVDAGVVVTLSARFQRSPARVQARLNELQAEATQGGVTFHLAHSNTQRRWNLVVGLVELAVSDLCDDDTLRSLVYSITDEAWPFDDRLTAGACLGRLDADQAMRFAELAGGLVGGLLTAEVNDLGHVRLYPIPNNGEANAHPTEHQPEPPVSETPDAR
jgi:hypothetical protein